MILTCLYIDSPDPAFLGLDSPYQAGFLDADVLRRYAGHPEYDLTETFLGRAAAVNDECFAIRAGDVLAAYGWYSSSANRFSDQLTLHFDPRWVYMYRGFTHPAYRGQRLHAIGMTMALAAYRSRGFEGLLTCVEHSNSASLRSCVRMGYRAFGRIYAVQLGRLPGLRHLKSTRLHQSTLLNRPIVHCSRGCSRFGLRLERHARTRPASGALRVLKD